MAAFTEQQMKEFSMAKYYNLDGQTAVVTGGSTGLGLAITRCLVSAGARVRAVISAGTPGSLLLFGAESSVQGGKKPSHSASSAWLCGLEAASYTASLLR